MRSGILLQTACVFQQVQKHSVVLLQKGSPKHYHFCQPGILVW